MSYWYQSLVLHFVIQELFGIQSIETSYGGQWHLSMFLSMIIMAVMFLMSLVNGSIWLEQWQPGQVALQQIQLSGQETNDYIDPMKLNQT